MKYFITLLLLIAFSRQTNAQLVIGSGAQWVTSGTVSLTMQDMDMVNNGTFIPGTGIVIFSGSSAGNIGGTSALNFNEIQLAKNAGIAVNLQSNITVMGKLNFVSGLLNLNQKNISLTGNGSLFNENENSRVIGTNGGEISYTTTLNNPLAVNPGNLGAIITSPANMGTVTVKRGHSVQTGSGLSNSIGRYYTITPQNNTGLNATLRFNYFDTENNGLDENSFVLYQSNDNGVFWNNLSQTTRNTVSNYIDKSGIGSLSKFTLGADVVVPGCSASGVVLNVKAGKQSTVAVTWTTATETNNKGFAVERRLKSEAKFTQVGYVNSKAASGNSTTQLSYSFTDNNTSTDTSYYRLRIESLSSSTCYSDIKVLLPRSSGGKGKPGAQANTSSASGLMQEVSLQPKLTVGPNPNNGYFFFSLDGISKTTAVTLFTMDGKMIGSYKVNNGQKQQVSGLKNGMYILKAEGMEAFKVMVQGSGANATPASAGYNNKY